MFSVGFKSSLVADLKKVKNISSHFANFKQVQNISCHFGDLKVLVFWFTPTQSVRPPLVIYPSLCSTCISYRTPCYSIVHQVLPTQPLPRVLRTLESVFYSQTFLTLHSFLLFQGLPGTGSSTSKLAGLHPDLWNIALAQLFA